MTISIVMPTIDLKRATETMIRAEAEADIDTVTVFVPDTQRRGFTKTCNEGMRAASSDTDILLLNDDVSDFPASWLRALSDTLHSSPKIGLVGPAGDVSTAETHDWTPGDIGRVNVGHLSFWCVLIRRAVIDEIGLLDERYIHYASDFDYCDRAIAAGWRCVWEKGVTLTHQGAASGGQRAWKGHDLSLYQHDKRKRDGWGALLQFC